MSVVFLICISILLLCWGFAGAMFGWSKWKESKAWKSPDDEGGGRDPGDDDPTNPFGIDPTDKGDWWKYVEKEKA